VSKADVPENSYIHSVRDWNALAVNLIDQIAQMTLTGPVYTKDGFLIQI